VSIRAIGVVLLAVSLLAVAYVVAGVPTQTAHGRAIGGADHEKCSASIGPSFVQFSVYQARDPRARYCKEIPEVGPATIVIDQSGAELREMTTDVRIIKDSGDTAGILGTGEFSSEAVVAPEVLDPITEKHVLPRLYPTGIIQFVHEFTSPGNYLAMVTAKNDHGQVFVSEFPFRVGQSRGWLLVWGGSAAAFVVAAVLFAFNRGVFPKLRLPERPM
jgi:hypothetical protein